MIAHENCGELTIVIPAFNEEAGIAGTLRSIAEEPRLAGARVIVVDDGSTDATGAVAAEYGAEVIRNWVNLGYGASLKRGVRAARRKLVAWFDADGQHSAADLADMVERLTREQAHAVIGARAPGSHVVRNRKLGKRVILMAAQAAAGRTIPDVNCGLRVFRRNVLVRYLDVLPDGFSASTTSTVLFLKRSYHVVFHAIRAHERVGKSTVRQVRDGLRTLHTITRLVLLFNALRTFSAVAGGIIAAGLLYGLAITLVRGAGFPVFAALLILLGVQVFCLGLVCDQLSALRLEHLGAAQWDDEGEHVQSTVPFQESESRAA
jgi:glycosyltransferase involved in cell wall biosynthesis